MQLPPNELPATFPLALVGRASSFLDVPSLRLCAKLIHAGAVLNPSALQKRVLQLTKSFRRSPPSVRIALNQCRLIAPLFGVDELRHAVLSLYVAAVGCIEGSISRKRGSQRRAQDRARHAVYRIAAKNILVGKHQLVSSLFCTGEAFPSNCAEAIAALGLISAIHPYIAAESNDTAKRFLAAVGNIALKAKPAAANDVVRAVATSLSHISSEVATAYLVPSFERALVREPEAAVSALLPVLRALELSDLSKFVTNSVVPAILVAMKSSNDKTREDGVNLAITLAFRVKSESALEDAIEQLCTLFKSAKYAYQRTATAQSLKRILCAKAEPSRGEISKLSATAIETSLKSIVNWLGSKKETNADARSEGCEALLLLLSAGSGLANFDVVQSAACKEAANLLCTFLMGVKSKDEEKSALLAFASQLECVPSLSSLVDLNAVLNHLSTLGVGVGRAKQEDAVRALAIIASFAKSDDRLTSAVRKSDLWLAIANKEISQLVIAPTNLSSEIDAKCALVACEWLVAISHPAAELYLVTIFKLAADKRHVVSRFARECIRRLRNTGNEEMMEQILDALWNTHFALAGAVHVPSSPYDFDDRGIHAELLGAALFAAVLPKVPLSCAPKVLFATHYPRLIRENPTSECIKVSRWWKLCCKALPQRKKEDEDESSWPWLKPCLEEIVGVQGLKSGNSVLIETAVNALGGLGKHLSKSDLVFRFWVANVAAFGPGNTPTIERIA